MLITIYLMEYVLSFHMMRKHGVKRKISLLFYMLDTISTHFIVETNEYD